MKACPYCAEQIQDNAVKCRYCGEFLDRPRKTPWYHRTSWLVVGLLTVGPLALPLLWIHPRFSTMTKMLLTVAILVASVILGEMFVRSLISIYDYYQELFRLMQQ